MSFPSLSSSYVTPGAPSRSPRAGSSTEGRATTSSGHSPRMLDQLERPTADKGKGRATEAGSREHRVSVPAKASTWRDRYNSDYLSMPYTTAKTTRGPSAKSTGPVSSNAGPSASPLPHSPQPPPRQGSPLPGPSSSTWSSVPPPPPPPPPLPRSPPRSPTAQQLLLRALSDVLKRLPRKSSQAEAVSRAMLWITDPDPDYAARLGRTDVRTLLKIDGLKERRVREELLSRALRQEKHDGTFDEVCDGQKMLLLVWKEMIRGERKERRWLKGPVWDIIWDRVPPGFPFLDRDEVKGYRLVDPDLQEGDKNAESWIRAIRHGPGDDHLRVPRAEVSVLSASPSNSSVGSEPPTPSTRRRSPPRPASQPPPRRTASPSKPSSQTRMSQHSGSSLKEAIVLESDEDEPPNGTQAGQRQRPPAIVIEDDEIEEIVLEDDDDLAVPVDHARTTPLKDLPSSSGQLAGMASQRTDTSFGLESTYTPSQAMAVDQAQDEWTHRTSGPSQHPLAQVNSPRTPARNGQPTSSQLRAEEEAFLNSPDVPVDTDGMDDGDEEEDAEEPDELPLSEYIIDGRSVWLHADQVVEDDEEGEETQLNGTSDQDPISMDEDSAEVGEPIIAVEDMDEDQEQSLPLVEDPSQTSSSRIGSSQASTPEPALFVGTAWLSWSEAGPDPVPATVHVIKGSDSYHYLSCQVQETGDAFSSPKLELMKANVNTQTRTVSWRRAMDGDQVKLMFDLDWVRFALHFKAVFSDPLVPTLIDLESDDDDQNDVGVLTQRALPTGDLGDDGLSAADEEGEEPVLVEANDSRRIEDYLASELRHTEALPEGPVTVNVIIGSFRLPKPREVPEPLFKRPTKCALRISVLCLLNGDSTVVSLHHHRSSLGPMTSDGSIPFSTPITVHVDSSNFELIDPKLPAFDGQPGLTPGSVLVLQVEFVQLADGQGRPSRWFLDAFESAQHDTFDSIQLPGAKIKLARMSDEGELERNPSRGRAVHLYLRDEPVDGGSFDVQMKWAGEEEEMESYEEEEPDEETDPVKEQEQEDETRPAEDIDRETPEDEMEEVEGETMSQELEDLTRKRKAAEVDETAQRPTAIPRLRSPVASTPSPVLDGQEPPSQEAAPIDEPPQVVVQPPSSSIGPPLSQPPVKDVSKTLPSLEPNRGETGSTASVMSVSLSDASTEETGEFRSHQSHTTSSRPPSATPPVDGRRPTTAPSSPVRLTEVIKTVTRETSRTVVTSTSTSYSSATSTTTAIVAGPSKPTSVASLLSASDVPSTSSSRSGSVIPAAASSSNALLKALTPEQRLYTLAYDPQSVNEPTFPRVDYNPGELSRASQRVLTGTLADELLALEEFDGDTSWRMRERDEAIFDIEGHHDGQKLVMCAWNRWVEKNSPSRIHAKIARAYTIGFVDEYFDFLDERRLHPFFVVHMSTLGAFELIDSTIFLAATARWGALKRAKVGGLPRPPRERWLYVQDEGYVLLKSESTSTEYHVKGSRLHVNGTAGRDGRQHDVVRMTFDRPVDIWQSLEKVKQSRHSEVIEDARQSYIKAENRVKAKAWGVTP